MSVAFGSVERSGREGEVGKGGPYCSDSSLDGKVFFSSLAQAKKFLTVVIRRQISIFTRKGYIVERCPHSQPFLLEHAVCAFREGVRATLTRNWVDAVRKGRSTASTLSLRSRRPETQGTSLMTTSISVLPGELHAPGMAFITSR